jgi:hypothetical protein
MVLFRSPHWRLEKPVGSSLIVLRRSAEPIVDLGLITKAFDEIARLIPVSERPQLNLLLDFRDAPMRNDPEFERVITDGQRKAFTGYRRISVLVRTATGKMQVRRRSREMGRSSAVFFEEQEALAYLTAP